LLKTKKAPREELDPARETRVSWSKCSCRRASSRPTPAQQQPLSSHFCDAGHCLGDRLDTRERKNPRSHNCICSSVQLQVEPVLWGAGKRRDCKASEKRMLDRLRFLLRAGHMYTCVQGDMQNMPLSSFATLRHYRDWRNLRDAKY
jgi:hypothetical protein